MHSNVAVHEPSTGIIRLEGDDNKPFLGQMHHVTPWRIRQGQIELVRAEIGVLCLLKNNKIMAVKMDLRRVRASMSSLSLEKERLTGWAALTNESSIANTR